MVGSVDIKTRPLKLGFLVDPNNAKQVREAIRLSSTLWGGHYFPIIPLYKRMPLSWNDGPLKPAPAQSVIIGYIEAFDPDVLVQLSNKIPDFIFALGLKIIKPDQIWEFSGEGISLYPQFGVGLVELLHEIYEEHYKFKAKYPVRVIFPGIPRDLSLFWACWFGEVPANMMPLLQRDLFESIDAEQFAFDVTKLEECTADNVLFPRRIVQFGIENYSAYGGHNRAYVFFLDGSSVEDIIDLWNLRAVGKYVMPVPKQLKGDPGLHKAVVGFLRQHRRPWEHNKAVCDTASIVRSHNSQMEEIEEYADRIKVTKAPNDPSGDPYFALQHWYPRIWDQWGREKDGVVPHNIYAGEKYSTDIGETRDLKVRIRSLLPRFAHKYGFHGNPRCANEIDLRFYGSGDYIAEVFPKFSGKHYSSSITGITSSTGEWRVGRNGLVRLVGNEFGETRQIPLAEDVLFAWLEDHDWKAKLSPPGLLAKRIYKLLDGFVGVLKNEKLLALLEHMNGGSVRKDGSPTEPREVYLERELEVGEVKQKLTSESHGRLYEWLVEFLNWGYVCNVPIA